MTFQELRLAAKDYPLFTSLDILKWFPSSSKQTLRGQLSFWTKKRYLERICRNLYKLADYPLQDELFLANKIYSPSYISLESALNYYGIIPDVPFSVTAVTLKKTKKFKTPFGIFSYHSIKKDLFFGFKTVSSGDKALNYAMATAEKAVFDFLYFNKKSINLKVFPREERFSFEKDFRWDWFAKIYHQVKEKRLQIICQRLARTYAY